MSVENSRYRPSEFESALQHRWEQDGLNAAIQYPDNAPNKYVLDMFPYPSGNGLHVGHLHGYVATDVMTRMLRAQGNNVLHPMGWDAFGLPAENAAIAQQVAPQELVGRNIKKFKDQLVRVGVTYDWERELSTTDPEYIKWTQDAFLEMHEQGLVEEIEAPINWCGSCQTGLANEDVHNGDCERCGTTVEKKPMRQWSIRITEYADKLLDDMDKLPEWDQSLLAIQREWIGRKEGFIVQGNVTANEAKIGSLDSFVQDPSVLLGAKYVAISPEALLGNEALKQYADAQPEIMEFAAKAVSLSQAERSGTGVLLEGATYTNPLTDEQLPVFVSDALSADDANGIAFGNPGLQQKDKKFLERNGFSIDPVSEYDAEMAEYIHDVAPDELRREVLAYLISKGTGESTKTYRLEDWVFSRQRYWGEPIPMVHCDDCGAVPVPRDQLPVLLPEVESYKPTGTGESPLASIEEWVNTECPDCDKPAKRETNTMPQWAGSSWYYLRFTDAHNDEALVSPEAQKRWPQVDVYVGGAEHAARHLIYARFWHKVLHNAGVVVDPEPFRRVEQVGLVLGPDGRKMSKRWGNVIDPMDVVEEYGSDTLRVYEMFMGDFSSPSPWSTEGIKGVRNFLERSWSLQNKLVDSTETPATQKVEIALNETIDKVEQDINSFKFNTAVASLMKLVNTFSKEGVNEQQYQKYLQLLQPFAPHIAEVLWEKVGGSYPIALQKWPEKSAVEAITQEKQVVVMIDGKKAGIVSVGIDDSEEQLADAAKESLAKVADAFSAGTVKRTIVPGNGKIINFVTK